MKFLHKAEEPEAVQTHAGPRPVTHAPLRPVEVTRPGFSLLELIVVMAIIGVLVASLTPFLLRRPQAQEWPQVTAEINNLTAAAVQTAMIKNRVCRLTVEPKKSGGLFTIEEEKTVPMEAKAGVVAVGMAREKTFEPIDGGLGSNQYELPKTITIDNVKVKNRLESEEHAGVYRCYITPRGLAQEMELTLTRDDGNRLQLKMNPFLNSFQDQKPSGGSRPSGSGRLS